MATLTRIHDTTRSQLHLTLATCQHVQYDYIFLDAENRILQKYKNPGGITRYFLRSIRWSVFEQRAPIKCFRVLLDMYSFAFILASLPFLTAAVPLAESFASRGIAVPIAKRNGSLNGVADTSKLQSRITGSVA